MHESRQPPTHPSPNPFPLLHPRGPHLCQIWSEALILVQACWRYAGAEGRDQHRRGLSKKERELLLETTNARAVTVADGKE